MNKRIWLIFILIICYWSASNSYVAASDGLHEISNSAGYLALFFAGGIALMFLQDKDKLQGDNNIACAQKKRR
ncbi:MAG: hypothetical protein DRO99_03125 [Candidatus Aenigmatarchaeota archaeon]|nr:MAG: hypothetical protein DRO99_03125 [Candidatus Aenigmarchaeota archaeon]